MTAAPLDQRGGSRGRPAAPPVRVHVLIAHTSGTDPVAFGRFAQRLATDAFPAIEKATGIRWTAHQARARRLDSNDPRSPTDFLDMALTEMIESPADAVVVVTDAPLVSARRVAVPGVASPSADVAVLSTAEFLDSPARRMRDLDDPVVRWNAASLLVHLVGHLLGLGHTVRGAMRPFAVDEDRIAVEPLLVRPDEAAAAVHRLREVEERTPTPWRRLRVQATMLGRRPGAALMPAVRSRAPALSLRLGSITAAAIVPVFIVLFTEEFWFIAAHLDRYRVWLVAAIAVLGGTGFMLLAQRLLFPHRDRYTTTSHVALTNVAVLVNTFLLMLGLLATVTGSVLVIELLLFPSDYVQNWFEDRFVVTLADHVYLALVVGSIATVTGAFGGSFHGRTILREYGLFLDQP